MKIKITNNQIVRATEALNQLEELDMPISVGHKLGVIQLSIEKYMEKFEEKRASLMKKYSKKDKDGNPEPAKDEEGNILKDRIQIEDMEGFAKDISELSTQEVSVDIPVKLTLEELEKSGVTIKMKYIRDLDPFLDKE